MPITEAIITNDYIFTAILVDSCAEGSDDILRYMVVIWNLIITEYEYFFKPE